MFSMRLVLVSTSVFSAAFILSTTNNALYVPWIYESAVSWLRPPYLYLVINCIIITIVATSKLHPTTHDDVPAPPPSSAHHQTHPTTDYNYDELELNARGGNEIVGDATSNKENECILTSNSEERNYVKPAASARFSHRRNSRGSPEGGRTVLGVCKAKKQDTLENTWKAITEGRSMPVSRHLKKSETWERERRQQENTPPMMKKSETFKKGKLRKEASLSQDELNRRVEAFIKKFNEEMRLQRQESLNQYTQIIH